MPRETLLFLTNLILLMIVRGLANNITDSVRNNEQQVFTSELRPETSLHFFLKDEIYSEKNLKQLFLYLEDVEKVDLKEEDMSKNMMKYMVLSRIQFDLYNSVFMHRYDSFHDLRLSGGPQVDHEQCLEQLKGMVNRLKAVKGGSHIHDLNIQLIMDTYGRVGSDVGGGNVIWVGGYSECARSKLQTPKNGKLPMRYCSVAMKSTSWTDSGALDEVLAVETGVCLPKVCDSISFKSKYALVEELIYLNDQEFVARGLNVSNLYCLPDAESELCQWWKSPMALSLVSAGGIWICILLVATASYELKNCKKSDDVGLPDDQNSQPPSILERISEALALTSNVKFLFMFDVAEPKPSEEIPRVKLDLSLIDGIKVWAMIYIIMNHAFLALPGIFKNNQDYLNETSIIMNSSIPRLNPLFAVNTFFAISGLLTSYIIFRENRSRSFLKKQMNWIYLVIYRYWRVMPTYLVVALFAKHVAKYISSGPLWDYGTSSMAQRMIFERESITWVLFFGANLKHTLDHCVLGGWYLASDFQFVLVTPVFITLLLRYPKWGRCFIIICILVSCMSNIVAFMSYEWDMRPIVRYPMRSLLYQTAIMNSIYVNPLFRIPSYLIGLLFGYHLFMFAEAESNRTRVKTDPASKPPIIFSKYHSSLAFAVFCVFLMLPAVGEQISSSKKHSKIFIATVMPLGHLLFAWCTAFYIVQAATGHGVKFLTRLLTFSFYKPLGRLSLCALLIQMEAIQYFSQSVTELTDMTTTKYIILPILCVIYTYLAAIILYITVEVPIRNITGILISRAISLR